MRACCLRAPRTGIDAQALRIYSGHTWQYGDRSELTLQYVHDMQGLVALMLDGKVPAQDYRVNIPFLDATFTYGGATITWNRAAASAWRAKADSRQRAVDVALETRRRGVAAQRLVVGAARAAESVEI